MPDGLIVSPRLVLRRRFGDPPPSSAASARSIAGPDTRPLTTKSATGGDYDLRCQTAGPLRIAGRGRAL